MGGEYRADQGVIEEGRQVGRLQTGGEGRLHGVGQAAGLGR
jgi:hypothetical protein